MNEDELRKYYGMPDGEIPFSVYEDHKVRELSERIRSHHGSRRSSNVHILAGREVEQVRRIAYLTAMKLFESSIPVIASGDQEKITEIQESGKYPVFLLDEGHIRSGLPVGQTYSPEIVSVMMDELKEKFQGNHAIFLSLSQATYESEFKESIEEEIEPEPVRKEEDDKPDMKESFHSQKLWFAFLFPAASFALTPLAQYIIYLGNITAGTANVLLDSYLALIFTPVVLSGIGIVLLFLLYGSLNGKNLKIFMSGLILMICEIIVPVILYIAGILGYSGYTSGVPSAAFLSTIFQLLALTAFCLILYPYAGKWQRASLIPAIGISVWYILAVYSIYMASLTIVYSPRVPLNTFLGFNPYLVPYNSISFGFALGPYDILGTLVTALSIASQLILSALYFWTAIILWDNSGFKISLLKRLRLTKV